MCRNTYLELNNNNEVSLGKCRIVNLEPNDDNEDLYRKSKVFYWEPNDDMNISREVHDCVPRPQ